MSYTPGTILSRDEPFDEPEEGETDLTPYNEIRVIGQSQTQDAGLDKEWTGEAGKAVTIAPTSFGATVDRPCGELERDYSVVSIPDLERKILPAKTAQVVLPGPTAEEVFRKEAVTA